MSAKIKSAGFALLALALLMVSAAAQAAGAGGTRTVTDSVGREVVFRFPVRRVIVTDDTIADAVRLFGKQSLVVGVENSMRHRGYFPDMAKRTAVGNQWRGLNWELIVALKPDVILMPHHPAVTPKVTAQANRLNIPVLALRWHYPESMVPAVETLGRVFGEPERAAGFIKWRKDCLAIISDRLSNTPPRKKLCAYAEVDISGPIGRAAGRGMPGDETMRLAGLDNICRFKHSKMVSAEWVMARDPDLVVMNDYGGKGEITGYLTRDEKTLKKYLREAMAREKFKNTKAVKNSRFYVMNSKMRGSMHMVGALYLAKAAYPGIFADVDPKEKHREFFERWLGLPYQGIWFYPSPRTQ